MAEQYDVVVIGAGVAGLTAAWLISSQGYRVAIVERKPLDKIGDRACGDAIGLHHFQELGWTPPQDVLNGSYKGVKIVSPSGNYSVIVYGEGVSVDSLKFGQWLLRNALDNGATLYDNSHFIDIRLDDKGFVRKAIIKDLKSGVKRDLEAKAFIDASGAVPALRSKLPREYPIAERPYMTDYNIAYREVIELREPISGEDKDYAIIFLNKKVAPGGYWWLFPKKEGSIANIGIGVIWGKGDYNPRLNYYRYIRGKYPGRLIHAGGGLVPTRRPLPTLVWRNIVVIGDAAYTVNPIHGGGRGSSMLAASIVSKHLGKALEDGRVNEYSLWGINKDFMKAYGAKQAGLDILRMYLQIMSDDDLEFVLAKKIVDGRSIYDLGTKASLAEEIISNVKRALSLLARPSLLNQLRIVKMYMDKAMEYYLQKYPETPDRLSNWLKEVNVLYSKYMRTIGFEPGPLVKW